MGLNILFYAQNLWRSMTAVLRDNDLRESYCIVSKLSIPEHTKQFVFAIREPESDAVIYILCAQNLSKRSDMDVECLIREIRPQAVIAQVGDGSLNDEFQPDDECGQSVGVGTVANSSSSIIDINDSLPTSPFQVLKRCFLHKINRDKYENMAANLVLKEIFGVGWNEHFVTAKRVAEEVGSSFMLLEPMIRISGEVESGIRFQGPRKLGSFAVSNYIHVQMVKSLSSYVVSPSSMNIRPKADYKPPKFAKSIYRLLVGLHNNKFFVDIPSMGRGLAHAQKMLNNVSRGEFVDPQLLSQVYIFRIAVERLRIALSNAGRPPLFNIIRDRNIAHTAFSDLPIEDRSHALLAHALKSQTKKFKSVVAVVDAGSYSGLRRHWNTPVPAEVKDIIGELVCNCRYDGESYTSNGKKQLLREKPVVAVEAGATAILGASSLSKVVHASTYMKIMPASLKLMMTQSQKVFAIVLGKTLGPSKLVVPAFTGSGVKTTAVKAAVSAEKIRAVTQSLLASAEKTSFSAMRVALYEIMRKRRVQPVGLLPWVTFGCSVATCSGLLLCGDGIECAVESFPAAPSIARLGRGIENLRQAAKAAGQEQNSRIQKHIDSLL